MVGGGGAHVGRGLRLGEGDLRLGLLGAAGDEIVEPLGGVLGELLGLGARFRDDRGGAGLRFGALLLEAREQRGRLVAQPRGLRRVRAWIASPRASSALQDRLCAPT